MLICLIGLTCIFLLFMATQGSSFFWSILNRVSLGNDCLLPFEEDDSDIKIAGSESSPSGQKEILVEIKELEKQKRNGNLDRAKQLGVRLSKEIAKLNGESAFGRDPSEDSEILTQRSLMLAFAACYGVETFLPDKIVQKAAVNAFYNTLRSDHKDLYEALRSSGAFSFYYLCVRRSDGVNRCIGKTFAMLCGKENDAVVEEFGQALFIRFTDTIKKIIEAMDFQTS